MASDQIELVTGLSPADAEAVMALGTRITLTPGAILFKLGENAQQVYLIKRGRLSLTLPMQVRDRDEDILIEERGPGQTVGWSALIPPHRYTLTARALIETDVLGLPRASLLDYFSAHPAVGYAVTRSVASVVGQRLQVFQTMWLREMQRVVKLSHA